MTIALTDEFADYKGHDKDCRNTGRDDYWTCPSCYNDLGNVGETETECQKCGCIIMCTVQYEPSCYSKVISWPVAGGKP